MATHIPTIDSQVHAYERDRPERPWSGTLAGPDEVTGDDMVAAMDAVGVDGALLVSPFSMLPLRCPLCHRSPREAPAPLRPDQAVRSAVGGDCRTDGGVDRYAGCGRSPSHALVRVVPGGSPGGQSHPRRRRPGRDTRECHVLGPTASVPGSGPPQPRHPVGRRPRGPGATLRATRPTGPVCGPAQCALARGTRQRGDQDRPTHSGACTLSHRPFPYPDIWEPLGRIFEAFGLGRCMWGTDWTRAVNLLTYEQGVEAFRVTDQLSDSERAELMGGTLGKIYNWSPRPRMSLSGGSHDEGSVDYEATVCLIVASFYETDSGHG